MNENELEKGHEEVRANATDLVVPVASFVYRYRHSLIGVPVLVAMVVAVIRLIVGVSYVSESRIKPDLRRAEVSQMAGFATQLGINLGSMTGGEQLEFYVELVRSPYLLARAAETEFVFASRPGGADTLRGNLTELYRIKGAARHDRLRRVVERLEKDISVNQNSSAGLITVRTEAPWFELAVALNRRLLQLVGEYNLEQRQSSAAARRQFIGERLDEAQVALDQAENTLKSFYESNRRYESSPDLRFEATRLERRIGLAQQLYTTLAQQFEEAKIDEVRDTPVITVVDPPESWVRKSGSILVDMVAWSMLAFFLVVGYGLGRENLWEPLRSWSDERKRRSGTSA